MKWSLTWFARVVVLGLLQFAAIKLGLYTAILHGNISPVWPSTGLAIAAMLLWGYSVWPGIFVGTTIAVLTTDIGWAFSLESGVANTVEPVTAVYLIRRFTGDEDPLGSTISVFKFIVFAGLIATATSATIGVSSVLTHGMAAKAQAASIWLTWWLGNMMGALIVAPVILTWANNPRIGTEPRQVGEVALIGLVIALLGSVIFANALPFRVGARHYPLAFLFIPFVIVAGFRFGRRGAASSVAAVSLIAIAATAHGLGPFARGSVNESLLLLQCYLLVVSITGMVLAGALHERYTARKALDLSEQRLELAAEGARLGLWDRRIPSGEEFRSRHWAGMLGFDPDEIGHISDSRLELVHPDDRDRVLQEQNDHLSGRTPVYVSEHRLRTKIGGWKWVQSRGTVVERDSAGNPVRMTGAVIDIDRRKKVEDALDRAREDLEDRVVERTADLTAMNEELRAEAEERKRTQHALEESEKRFRSLVEHIPGAVYRRRPSPPWHVEHISEEIEALTGHSAQDFIEMGNPAYGDLILPEDFPAVEAAIDAAVEEKKPYVMEYRIQDVGGRIRWVYDRGRGVYDADGRLVWLDGVIIDITDKKKSEEERDRLAREVKHFAYIVSHDLRTPLINLKGFCGILSSALDTVRTTLDEAIPHLSPETAAEMKTALDEDVPESLEFIESSVARMNRLIDAILKLSRYEHNKLEPVEIDMTRLVTETLDYIAHRDAHPDLELRTGDLPTVVADRTAMEQIMANLLDNALKYRKPDEKLVIEIRGFQTADETVFHVRDNGRGVEPEDRENIFEIFQRSRSTDLPGEGMGLAYVRTLVRRHGGRIWCESEPGRGAAFTFTVGRPPVPPESEN